MTGSSRKLPKEDRYISQVEAARTRGVSKQAIADLIRRGRLNYVEVAGRKLLLKSEVESFQAKPNTGRPKKKQTAKKAAAAKKKI